MAAPEILTRVFEQQTGGLVPAGTEGLYAMVQRMHSRTAELVRSGRWERARVEEVYLKARAYIRLQGLQLVRPAVGEFLIGDVPALSFRDGQIGVLGGVALMDAKTVNLPLGPKLMAALHSKDETVEIDAPAVQVLNRAQVVAAQERVYMRIGSGLEDFVRQLRPPTIPRRGMPAR